MQVRRSCWSPTFDVRFLEFHCCSFSISNLAKQIAKRLRLIKMGRMRRVFKPHQLLAGRLKRIEIAFCGSARRNHVQSTLYEDNRRVEARKQTSRYS
jgi:hypothetical protein